MVVVVVVVVGKLWTSPEILRENFPPPRGTQRGDVYSFSIVCFEVMMRSEPYSFDHMTARGRLYSLRYLLLSLPPHLQLEGDTDTGHWCLCLSVAPVGRPRRNHVKNCHPNKTHHHHHHHHLFVQITHQYDHLIYDNRTGQQGTNVHFNVTRWISGLPSWMMNNLCKCSRFVSL